MPVRTDLEPGLATVWAELKQHLERQVRRLNEEISHYPTPIARCDQHLAALLDQRAALYARLKRMDELSGAVHEIQALLDAPADVTDNATLTKLETT